MPSDSSGMVETGRGGGDLPIPTLLTRWLERFGPGPVAVLMCLFASVAAPLALAHGGEKVFSGEVGPYDAVAKKLIEDDSSKSMLEYSVVLYGAERRRPIPADRASIQVRAETPDGSVGPFNAEAFGNRYYVYVPVQQGGTWTMDVAVAGDRGEARFTHEMEVPRSGLVGLVTGASPYVLVGIALAALAFIGGVVFGLVRRSRVQGANSLHHRFPR